MLLLTFTHNSISRVSRKTRAVERSFCVRAVSVIMTVVSFGSTFLDICKVNCSYYNLGLISSM